ncbi:MAG: acetyl-CoA carboxylase biotin carboxylase subunit [Rhodobacteraceae bacterium]|nr:acetyl-CoA carboxylase biotin carboxylase subunit [Paracoccaceae bacterium]
MEKLLIANRGEIGRRIIRSARALGIRTVALYSEADAGLAHVEEADEAVAIGPAPARESYLDVDRVLDAARQTGADAVHPGYGFLSENADFAERVIAAGLTWVGPAPETIRAMGDKARARTLAEAAGVPVVPGSGRIPPGSVMDVEAEAARIGYPLLVKASAGGGGIGMRRVDGPAQLAATVAATQSMAGKAFGDGTVFLERFVPRARHIEIQVFGLGEAGAVHLRERDCSLQRRFQKVIEESPAPGLPEGVRQRMAEAALALCRHTAYRGAGTIEFIVDAVSFDFYFLEMNTRIQVEHPVTEMVTGRDLVAMQLRFAADTLGRVEQDAIRFSGHAIECRLYAESPERNFLPSPGTLTRFRPPPVGPDLRLDAAYREGETVTPFYDPMIAKLIAHGATREQACNRAIDALRQFEIDGIRTNRDFLIACLENPGFRAGDIYTGFIEDNRATLLHYA